MSSLCSWVNNDRYISNESALQIALGNINVNTGERFADYNPDTATKVTVVSTVVSNNYVVFCLSFFTENVMIGVREI